MSDWIKPVGIEDIEESKTYFVGLKRGEGYLFWSRYLSGKEMWSVKPGIAVRFIGNFKLKEFVKQAPDLVAVEVPADADKRWKARKHPRRSTQFK